MATPTGMSRSGRVLKKSVKLLEMENEVKTPKISIKSPKYSESSIVSNSAEDLLVVKNSNVKPIVLIPKDLKNDLEKEAKPTVSVTAPIVANLSSRPSTSNIFQVVRNPNTNSLILKMKTNTNTEKPQVVSESNENTFKRAFENPQLSTPKKLKTLETETKQTPSFKGMLSPIVQVDKDTKAKIQQSFASSTPKINTIISSKMILARSIQEQRRINQANRTRLLEEQKSTSVTPNTNSGTSTTTRSSRNTTDSDTIKKKKPTISAYVLWCKENRSQIQSTYPELDFANLSKKMGEIWHTLPQTEKATWFRKAHVIAKQGYNFCPVTNGPNSNSFYDVDDLKPKIVSGNLTLPITVDTLQLYDESFSKNETDVVYENEPHKLGTELIDIQAYLSILGDSLMTIGSYIQRGIKYNSDIDYSLMAALSTFLDSILVAMSTLIGLLTTIPQLQINKDNVGKLMENISYFMPPSEI